MKCVALLPCEKIIVDKEGASSLITVISNLKTKLQKVEAGHPAEQLEIMSNAVMPMTWWIYTQWDPNQDDIGKQFEQMYQVFWPNGDKLLETSLQFTQEDERKKESSFYIVGLPVGQEGKVRILTWLHFEGRRVTDMSETYFRILHQAVETKTQSQPRRS
jgi:hypothetical protein